jgi:hypothetical protein
MFIEKVIQFRSEKVLKRCSIPIGGHPYSNIALFKKVITPYTKLKNGAPQSNLMAFEVPEGYYETNTGNAVC